MTYIPDEWFDNKENAEIVFDLLENEQEPDKVKKRLEEIGEKTILQKYIDCEILTQL